MPTSFSVPEGESYEWPMVPNLPARFWPKVDVGDVDECWPWLAFRNPAGYGMIRNGTRMALAHRVAWVISEGQIPLGLHALHTCDNPACCNRRHLYLGTNDENIADKMDRGRSHFDQPRKRGELHHNAKLTRESVEAIRAAANGTRGEGKRLAEQYGVSRATICRILSGKIWK